MVPKQSQIKLSNEKVQVILRSWWHLMIIGFSFAVVSWESLSSFGWFCEEPLSWFSVAISAVAVQRKVFWAWSWSFVHTVWGGVAKHPPPQLNSDKACIMTWHTFTTVSVSLNLMRTVEVLAKGILLNSCETSSLRSPALQCTRLTRSSKTNSVFCCHCCSLLIAELQCDCDQQTKILFLLWKNISTHLQCCSNKQFHFVSCWWQWWQTHQLKHLVEWSCDALLFFACFLHPVCFFDVSFCANQTLSWNHHEHFLDMLSQSLLFLIAETIQAKFQLSRAEQSSQSLRRSGCCRHLIWCLQGHKCQQFKCSWLNCCFASINFGNFFGVHPSVWLTQPVDITNGCMFLSTENDSDDGVRDGATCRQLFVWEETLVGTLGRHMQTLAVDWPQLVLHWPIAKLNTSSFGVVCVPNGCALSRARALIERSIGAAVEGRSLSCPMLCFFGAQQIGPFEASFHCSSFSQVWSVAAANASHAETGPGGNFGVGWGHRTQRSMWSGQKEHCFFKTDTETLHGRWFPRTKNGLMLFFNNWHASIVRAHNWTKKKSGCATSWWLSASFRNPLLEDITSSLSERAHTCLMALPECHAKHSWRHFDLKKLANAHSSRILTQKLMKTLFGHACHWQQPRDWQVDKKTAFWVMIVWKSKQTMLIQKMFMKKHMTPLSPNCQR